MHQPYPEHPTAILDELIALARRFGEDPGFSRGGGGNASAKADGVLWIKPSGVPLATLQADALVPLDTARLLEMLESDPAVTHPGDDPVMRVAVEARLAPAGGRRPSVELLFHALLPERFVLHTHPVLVNAVGCNRDGAELARRLFGDGVIWVPYTDPGLPLANAIRAARAEHEARTGTPPPRLTLLANHGLIVTGDTARDIEDATAWLVERIEAAIAATPEPALPVALDAGTARALVDTLAPTLRAHLSTDARRRILAFDDDPVAASFTATDEGRAFVLGGPLTPDQIVYAGSNPLLLDLPADADPAALPALVARAARCPPRGDGRRPDHRGRARAGPVRRGRHLGAGRHRPPHLPRRPARRGRREPPGRRPAPRRCRARVHRGVGGRGLPQADRRGRRAAGPRRGSRRARDGRRAGLRPRHRGGPRGPGRARRPRGPQRDPRARRTPRGWPRASGPAARRRSR